MGAKKDNEPQPGVPLGKSNKLPKKNQNKTGPLTRFNINQLPQKTVVTTLLCFITKVTVIVRDMTGL